MNGVEQTTIEPNATADVESTRHLASFTLLDTVAGFTSIQENLSVLKFCASDVVSIR